MPLTTSLRQRRGEHGSSRLWGVFGKWALFLGLLLLVMYPRLDRLPVTLQRYLNPNDLIDPQAPGLDGLIAEFDEERQIDWTPKQLTKEIQRYIYKRVPYAHDWTLWWNVDYFPTVEETIAKGSEDCDGRAVVAASMLEHYGIPATLENDLSHVWVVTEYGRTLDHGGETTVVESTEDGIRIRWGAAVRQVANSVSWMVSAFPLIRELILLLAAWLLLGGRRKGMQGMMIGLLMVIGLLLVRDGVKLTVLTTWVGWILLIGSTLWVWRMRPPISQYSSRSM